MEIDRNAQQRLAEAIRIWMQRLQNYPGWRDWKRSQIGYTMNFDDEFFAPEDVEREFKFTPEMAKEHSVVTSYMELLNTANALRDVEWYFRRYPFSSAPISRESHLRYCCEMFFGRFYQFRERLKELSKNIKVAAPDHGLDFGSFIRQFDKEFDQEIRERHSVHHREAFDDVGISRIALLELTASPDADGWHARRYQSHYRKTARIWAERTRRRSQKLDQFVEAIAEALLLACPFLSFSEE